MIGFIQSLLLYVVPFLLVLTLVVTVHELGHFWAARSFKVAIDRFAIGFGRGVAGWRDKHGVEWRIGWLPLGGYVRFAGDENAASVPDKESLETLRQQVIAQEGEAAVSSYLHFKPLWQRAVVVAAGPFANFVLATVLFAGLLMTVGETVTTPRVGAVVPQSAAAQAGFESGDKILKADGQRLASFEDLTRYVVLRANVPIDFTVDRGGRELELTATPRLMALGDGVGEGEKVGVLGIRSSNDPADYDRVRYNPIVAVAKGAERTWDVLSTTVYYLGRIITGQMPADQIRSVLGIAQASGDVAKASAEGAPNAPMMVLGGAIGLLNLAAIMSVSVGFMNLLPIPVLDGGHLLFYAYEAVARRPLAERVQAAGYRVGLALIAAFMLFATFNDLHRLRVFEFIGGLFS